MRVLQLARSRKCQGSRGDSTARAAVSRFAAGIKRRRSEFLHQASARVIRDYDFIAVEKLNVEGLAKGCLGHEVRDAGWGKFIRMLRYKAERAGAWVSMVDAHETTQICSGCGVKVRKEWGDRLHICSNCGLSLHRDLNAARNILSRAGVGPSLRNVVGYDERAGENLCGVETVVAPNRDTA
jgi:putative transposase